MIRGYIDRLGVSERTLELEGRQWGAEAWP